METIGKTRCRMLATLLTDYGVTDAVVSPGSRNAPLIVAFARSPLVLHYVVDERTAAFIALGIAAATSRPVALVCTSGTAMLNYAPALAEAYYRRIPLIAITADRPAGLIDQRDSQTIRQSGALDAIVRKSVDIAPDSGCRSDDMWANRLINDAMTAALGCIAGPIHINMQIDLPLNDMTDDRTPVPAHRIKAFRSQSDTLSHDALSYLKSCISPDSRVMLLAGSLQENETFDIGAFGDCVAVVAEPAANLAGAIPAGLIDRHCSEFAAPDVLVTVGGSIVSARIKRFLRSSTNIIHISAGFDDNYVDTYGHLTARFDYPPSALAKGLESLTRHSTTDYRTELLAVAEKERQRLETVNPASPLHIFASLAKISQHIEQLHISNGSAIRYAQPFEWQTHIEANRGVSGIDGSTSTAVGASLVIAGPVVLVSGDMSAAYDIGAFGVKGIKANFKMIILDNDGGDIFRNIPSTASFAEREPYLCAMPAISACDVASAAGFEVIRTAADEITPERLLDFVNLNRPAILNIKIDPNNSQQLL